MHRFRTLLAATAAFAVAAAAPVAATPLGALTAEWFDISTSDVDVGKSGSGAGMVQSTLAANGSMVRSAASAAASTSSAFHIGDVNSAGEVQWYTIHSNANGTVKADTYYNTNYGTVSIPFSQTSNLYPGGGSSNGGTAGYVAAHLYGTFSMATAGTITITSGSDDDLWVFIDGVLKVDHGGVQGYNPSPTAVSALSAGTHTIDFFYADRQVVQAGLSITADIAFAPAAVPEPATLALFGVALAGLGLARRRRV